MSVFDQLVASLRRAEFAQLALWGGLGLATVAMIVMLRRRWRHASPLYKCTVFSVWSHLLLVIYATSIQIVAERQGPGSGPGPGGGEPIPVRLNLTQVDEPAKPEPKPPQPTIEKPRPTSDPTIPRNLTAALPQSMPVSRPRNPSSPPIEIPALSPAAVAPKPLPIAKLDLPSLELPKPAAPTSIPSSATGSPASTAASADSLTPIAATPQPPVAAAVALPSTTAISTPAAMPAQLEPFALPQLYRERTAADRERIATAHGGSKDTEAAVRLALRWLAANQEADGRWDASRFGAGRETETLGQNRGGAGANADTGISGLALLALFGAGHTHQRGDYQTTVGRGLDFLAASQHADGNVAGNAEPFAFMYCHGMATLALSEALAMTGDARLRPIVERAIGYTLRAQNRTTGGWRYRPGDVGDMSQLGWQLMALKSAELAGLDFPSDTRRGIERFTASVSSGPGGGLASYRPQERVSHPMTAEALVVRQFLGTPRNSPALDEAGNYLLGELPGAAQPNFYYWYYGTLGMYQLQGDHWRRWNNALTRQLLGSQTIAGEAAGSWEPNDVWGGYGGRVYSTALATLCLEVYYRYLPLYVEAASNGGSPARK
jgi:hypothetical protein